MQETNQKKYLQDKDIITIGYNNCLLSAQGFKQSTVLMLPLTQCNLFTTLFQIEGQIIFDEPLYLVHMLSGKYLSCGGRGVKLTAKKKASCQILLKSIFRCQTVVTRKIRINQQVIISPADLRTRDDNLSLVASQFRHKYKSGCQILIKRNQSSNFLLTVRNLRLQIPLSITTLQIYQIINVQSQKTMYLQSNMINFSKNINQHSTYIQLLHRDSIYNEFSQKIVKFNQQILIRSLKYNKYISISIIGKIQLLTQPNQSCIFEIQQYTDQQLNQKSLIKIKHLLSQKYLSINTQQSIQQFKLSNIYQFRKISQINLRKTLFINQLSLTLKQQINKKLSNYQTKLKIKDLLIQLSKFIYGSINIQKFLIISHSLQKNNDNQYKIIISQQQQDLLANVGILDIFIIIIQTFLPSLKGYQNNNHVNQQQKQIADQKDILLYTMLITAGVCYHHPINTKLLCRGINLYFQAIGYVQGSLQCLYQIFKNNKQLLLILQTAEHKISQRQSIYSIDLLLQILKNNNYTIQTRIKIIKFLQCLSLSKSTSTSQNISRHQISILKAINNKKLLNIFIPIANNQHNELKIAVSNSSDSLQLQELIMWKNKYPNQVMILQTQFNLYASVCHGQNQINLIYIKKLLSQQIIYRYLKGSLSPQFRQILMRILIEIYLVHEKRSNNIIIINQQKKSKRNRNNTLSDRSITNRLIVQQQIQMTQYISINKKNKHSQCLQNIQNLILQVTRKAIKNQIIDCSFYMNIKALKKFLQMQILNNYQVKQFKQILIQFIKQYSQQSFLEEQKRNLIVEILKIFSYYQQIQKKQLSQQLIQKFLQINQLSLINIQNNFIQFVNKNYISNKQQLDQINILKILIRGSLRYQDQQIFYHTGYLMKIINNRLQLLVQCLKDKIIIVDLWSLQFYKRVVNVVNNFKKTIDQYKDSRGNQMTMGSIQQNLNQIIGQLNYFYYQWSKQDNTGISPLTQNLFRQLSVYQLIVNFLIQNSTQILIRPSLSTIFETCFNNLMLFINNHDKNALLLNKFLNNGILIFQQQDSGQSKFLYKLLQMPIPRQYLINQIYQCLILSLSATKQPNPYQLLALIKIFMDHKIQRQKLQNFVSLILKKQNLLLKLLKISKKHNYQNYTFQFSSNVKDKQKYHRSWSLYLMQLSKLLLLLIQQSAERGILIQLFRNYISISMIIKSLNYRDLLENISLQQLNSTLMKRQLIKLFNVLHIDNLKNANSQIQQILSYTQSTHQKIVHSQTDFIGGKQILIEQLQSGRINQQGKVIIQSFFNSKQAKKQFRTNFNSTYMILTVYYPFITKLLYVLSLTNTQQHNQSTILLDIIYRKYKEIVQSKLTYSQYYTHYKDYANAIQYCQETFRRKIGVNYNLQGRQDQDIQQYDQQTYKMIYIPNKIQNLIGNYQSSSNSKQKKIYKCIINLLFSKKIRNQLIKKKNKQIYKLPQQDISHTYYLINKLIENKIQQLDSFAYMFDTLLSGVNNIDNYQIISKICKIIGQQNQDISGKRLCKFLTLNNYILQSKNQQQQQSYAIFSRIKKSTFSKKINKLEDTQSISLYSNSFLQRVLNIIQQQKQLYLSYSSYKHLNKAMLTQCLSYELSQDVPTIQLCLIWLRNVLQNLPPNQKDSLYQLVTGVVQLLKAYCHFINEFKGKYLSKQLKYKLQLCLSVLFHAITGINMKNMIYMIQRQLWNQINIILALQDNFNKCRQQMNYDTDQLFRRISSHLKNRPKNYLQQIEQISKNTFKFYGKQFSIDNFPLFPTKSYYYRIKKWVIAVIKQFKHLPTQTINQFMSRISLNIVDRNIFDTWQKHQKLFVEYNIGSIDIQMIYQQKDYDYQIAKNMCLQNAVDLCSLKMFIQNSSGNGQLQSQYKNLRIQIINSHKIQSALSSITSFIKDFFLLFISCCIPIFRSPKKLQQKKDIQQIMKFFFTKIGRIQLLSNNKIHTCDFIIRPQCRINKSLQQKFINNINFLSVQLKLQSIIKQAMYFILYYQNQVNFYSKFNKITVMKFLDKHFNIFKIISFLLVVIQNILLVSNSQSDSQYFRSNDINQPFVIIQIINMIISYIILFAYLMKQLPLLIARTNAQLANRAASYGSNFKNYSPITKFAIKISKIIFYPTMIYHILYTLALSLALYNKLFTVLVLLDIFFQIPTLRNLLYAVWRPKLQLILAILSFTLVQYFFSTFMFFVFKDQTFPYCQTLGKCFGFVFVTTYKAVGGFVGYLFQRSIAYNQQASVVVNFFEIFQDIYVVLVFQIFFALILSIIIDNFTQIRTQQNIRKQYLQSFCIVCNLDRSLFNVSSKMNFKGHIALDHSIWNYFYYYQYILKKQPIFRTYYQQQIYQKRNADWLPNNYAKDIKQPQNKQLKLLI